MARGLLRLMDKHQRSGRGKRVGLSWCSHSNCSAVRHARSVGIALILQSHTWSTCTSCLYFVLLLFLLCIFPVTLLQYFFVVCSTFCANYFLLSLPMYLSLLCLSVSLTVMCLRVCLSQSSVLCWEAATWTGSNAWRGQSFRVRHGWRSAFSPLIPHHHWAHRPGVAM